MREEVGTLEAKLRSEFKMIHDLGMQSHLVQYFELHSTIVRDLGKCRGNFCVGGVEAFVLVEGFVLVVEGFVLVVMVAVVLVVKPFRGGGKGFCVACCVGGSLCVYVAFRF